MSDFGNDLLDSPGADAPGELAALAAAREVPPPSAQTVAAALAAVRAAAAGEAAPDAPATPAPAQRPSRRRWIAAAACVAAIAAGVSVLPTVGKGGESPASANAASAFLNEVAGHTGGPSPAQARTLAVRLLEERPGYAPYRTTLVMARSGLGYVAIRNAPAGPFFSPRLTWDRTLRLPSGTQALRARLQEVTPRGGSTFQVIGGLLTMSPVTPRVRAALYRVLATVPGVKLLGPGKDSQGRDGRWIAEERGSLRWKLLIEPSTGRLLEQQEVTLRPLPSPCRTAPEQRFCPPDLRAGDTVARMTILSSRLS
jgi:hypothetical protein